MSWELFFLGFMMPIFTNLTSDLARNRVNEPKQAKSIIIFSDLRIPWFTIKRLVLASGTDLDRSGRVGSRFTAGTSFNHSKT